MRRSTALVALTTGLLLGGPALGAQAATGTAAGGSPNIATMAPDCAWLNTGQLRATAVAEPHTKLVVGHSDTRPPGLTVYTCAWQRAGAPSYESTLFIGTGRQFPRTCQGFTPGPVAPLKGGPRGAVWSLQQGALACEIVNGHFVVMSAEASDPHTLVQPMWQLWADLALGSPVLHQLAGLPARAKLTEAATPTKNLAENPLRGDRSVQFGWRMSGSAYANGAIVLEYGASACRHFQLDAANAGPLPGGPAGARWYDSFLYGYPVAMMCVRGSHGAPNTYVLVTGKVPMGISGPFAAALNTLQWELMGHR